MFLNELHEYGYNTHYKVPYKKINNYKCDFPLFDPIGLVTCQNENQSLTMYSYRDSYTNALISYYAETFKNTKYIWSYKINPEEIKNADIIILETIERFLPGIIKEIEGNNNAV